MAKPRWTDEELVKQVPKAKNWRDLMFRLGLTPMNGSRKRIQQRVARLGLDTNHFPLQVKGRICLIDDCDKKSHAYGYCAAHYGYLKRNGDPLKTTRVVKGFSITKQGYVIIWKPTDSLVSSPDGEIFEHRYVMAQHLGRPLRSDEQVHHKNGNRADNRIENLELWTSNHPSGGRVTDLVVWAKEILEIYKDFL
jgi:hypothetical protein